jgi:hypothetical protein
VKKKCHMDIPHYVFHKMEPQFGELKPLFLKFAHSHIDINEIKDIMNRVDADLVAGTLKPSPESFGREADVKTALRKVFCTVASDKKLEEIEEVYKRSCAKYKNTFLKMVQERTKRELEEAEVDSSWRDLTSIYPDEFDGDNISYGNFHSCKFKDIKSADETPVWRLGHVCHSIQGLVWQISGLYKEFCREPDVLVSEQSKIQVVEGLIRLAHYVLDSSTIVHLMQTSGPFHNNLEEDLDEVVTDLLPKVEVKVNCDLIGAFKKDPYGEADKRAKATFSRFYFPVLELYGKETRDNGTPSKAFSKGKGLDLALDIIQNACQNLADFWGYTLEICAVEKNMREYVELNGLDPST